MTSLRHTAFAAAFEAIALTRADRWGRGLAQGKGVILTLHHVRPAETRGFAPNALLEITPDFLDATLRLIRQEGYDIVSLDEGLSRLQDPRPSRFFVVLTFDDGYRDNVEHAWPSWPSTTRPGRCSSRRVLPTAPRGCGGWSWKSRSGASRPWPSPLPDGAFAADTADDAGKRHAFEVLYWRLRKQPEAILLSAISELARQAGVDVAALVERECLPWETLRALSGAPGVTIGAHTLGHPMLAKHPDDVARHEIEAGKARLEAELGIAIRHFAYPVGDPTSAGPREFACAAQAGFSSAVTTRPGHLFGRPRAACARLAARFANGLHQTEAALRALLSGLPFLAWNRGRRLNVT